MAKAGGKGGVIGAVLRAGAAMLGAGAEIGAKQRNNLSALTNSLSTVSHMIGSICSAMKNGKGNPNVLANLLSVAESFKVTLESQNRARLTRQREAKQQLELGTPTPTNPQAAPQPRRAAPQQRPAPGLAPKPTFTE